MKKIIALAIATMVFVGLSLAQDVGKSSSYGFVIVTNAGPSFVWTNDNAYPFKFNSMVFNKSTINTTTVDVVHTYKVRQEVGNVVETNIMDAVVTNYYSQVTNITETVVTNRLLTANNTGKVIYDLNDIQQPYIQLGDIIRWTHSDLTTNLFIFDTIR